MLNSVKDKVKGDYVWGSVFDPDGRQTQALGSDKEIFDHDLAGFESAYYSEFGSSKYVCFAHSKNIIELEPKFVKAGIYTNKGWSKPHMGENKTFSAFTLNYQRLVNYKNYFLIPALPEKPGSAARLVLYDSGFNPVKIIELKGVQESYWYYITITGDNMVLYNKNSSSDPSFYLFDLSKLGL
jgi:hypothetical protein